jgi:hypothetical protein
MKRSIEADELARHHVDAPTLAPHISAMIDRAFRPR